MRMHASAPSAAEAIARARLNAQTYPTLAMDEIMDAVDDARR